MDQTENAPRIRDYATLALILGTTAFGAFQIGKLGVDWTREGIRSIKEKKNQK